MPATRNLADSDKDLADSDKDLAEPDKGKGDSSCIVWRDTTALGWGAVHLRSHRVGRCEQLSGQGSSAMEERTAPIAGGCPASSWS